MPAPQTPRAPLPYDSFDATPTLARALGAMTRMQNQRGCWVGEVVWCTMLISQHIIVSHLIGQPLSPERKEKYLRYYRA